MDAATLGLLAATFTASFVEFVEALTIVLAMGLTRGWRSALAGTALALLALVAFTLAAGYALTSWLPEAALQLAVGTLLLIFGLQWLRKAVLRSAGLKSLHHEDEEFAIQTEVATAAARQQRWGLDWFGFVVSFKGVFLEGVEVVFVVITFGLSADGVGIAAVGAAAAGLVVLTAGVALRKPLASIPENNLKYGVGVLLSSFGTFWALEGLGTFNDSSNSLEWPGGDLVILALVVTWILLSRVLVRALRKPPSDDAVLPNNTHVLPLETA